MCHLSSSPLSPRIVVHALVAGCASLLMGCSSDSDEGSFGGAGTTSATGAEGSGEDSTEGPFGSGDDGDDGGDNTSTGGSSGSGDDGDDGGDNTSTGGDGSIQEDPPPPNDLDPGDGTAKTGATTVYNGDASDTNGGQTGCSLRDDNRYNIQFSTIYPAPTKLFVLVSLPRDQITGTRSLEVEDADYDDWTGIKTGRVSIFGGKAGEGQVGAEGQVWFTIIDGKVEVRFQDVKLRPREGSNKLNGNTISAAYLCGDALE